MAETTRLRLTRALLLLSAGAIFLLGYCAFATAVSARVWDPGGLLLLGTALAVQLVLLATCLTQVRRYSTTEKIALGLLCTSFIAAAAGMLAIAMPQSGHPSIAILFFVFPVAINRLLIPVTLLVLALSALTGGGKRFAATGFACVVLSTFLFSDLRFFVPAAADWLFGTTVVSRSVRRIDYRQPNSNEMLEDIALIRTRRGLSLETMHQLEIVAERAPQHRSVVIAEIHSRYGKLRDPELKLRALFLLDRLATGVPSDQKGWSDVTGFFCSLSGRKDGRVSDTAAMFLAKSLLPMVSDAGYDDCIRELGEYLSERELHPPDDLNPATGASYTYRTLNVVSEIEKAADLLMAEEAGDTATRRLAAHRLQAFVPYLRARQLNESKGGQQPSDPHARKCGEVAAKVEQLR